MVRQTLKKQVETMLTNEYEKALAKDYVRKPMAFALYKTWKYFDKNEKVREVCKVEAE